MNLQLIEKRIVREDGALDVHSIFGTIQGEGPFVGMPAIFVRLAGCNLQCPSCDTDYTSQRTLMEIPILLSHINDIARQGTYHLIVLTGGEPFRQACGLFIKAALTEGFLVQIETNGTLYDESLDVLDPGEADGLTVVCSPKTEKTAYGIHNLADHYKYIIEEGKVAEDGLPTTSLGMKGAPARPPKHFTGDIFLQPMDTGSLAQNEENTKEAVSQCMKHGFRLCLQTHKIVGLP